MTSFTRVELDAFAFIVAFSMGSPVTPLKPLFLAGELSSHYRLADPTENF